MNSSATQVNLILTGATGMVGEGVLHVCLESEKVGQVLVVGRKTCGKTHPKLKEILIPDFFNLSSLANQLREYHACLFCLGVSSVGLKEEEYYKLTYTLTLRFAQACHDQNPEMTFCYISGAGTDSTEKGRSMWARVKGKTENDLTRLFNHAYNFRPGALEPIEGMKNTLKMYKYLGWLIPLFRLVAPRAICKLEDLGKALINAALRGYNKQIIEVRDIMVLAKN